MERDGESLREGGGGGEGRGKALAGKDPQVMWVEHMERVYGRA